MTVGIVKATWDGLSGGQGLTQLAIVAAGGASWTVANANAATAAVRALFGDCSAYLPAGVTVNVQTTVDQYEEITGLLTESVTATNTPLPVPGGYAGKWAQGVGAKLTWETGFIRNGRRVRGRTYLVPGASAMFDNDGSLIAGAQTAITTAANTFRASLSSSGLGLMVWSRPSSTGAGDGQVTAVNGVSLKDKSAILRGRRD